MVPPDLSEMGIEMNRKLALANAKSQTHVQKDIDAPPG
jgi:hypothetical protein